MKEELIMPPGTVHISAKNGLGSKNWGLVNKAHPLVARCGRQTGAGPAIAQPPTLISPLVLQLSVPLTYRCLLL